MKFNLSPDEVVTNFFFRQILKQSARNIEIYDNLQKEFLYKTTLEAGARATSNFFEHGAGVVGENMLL